MAFFLKTYNMLQNKKIFISPLDWGLGHTTRCIPIIQSLLELNANVYVGVNEEQKKLLELENLNVEYISFKGYAITYPSSSKMAWKMSVQIPKILTRIKQEKEELEALIQKHNFDLVISDNRFGLYAKNVPSVYITHQINIQAPLGIDKLLYHFHKQFINKFTQCWIPDYKDENLNLAGRLSHGKLEDNYYYIGTLSRFKQAIVTNDKEYIYLAVISGPEPQRSLFENYVLDLFSSSNKKCAVLGGKPLEERIEKYNNIDYFSHLDTEDLQELMRISEKVIARPGYSTIMDLSILQKPVLFIPTPNQTEQEYLARYLKQKYNIDYCLQEEIQDLAFRKEYNTLPLFQNEYLTKTIRHLIQKILS